MVQPTITLTLTHEMITVLIILGVTVIFSLINFIRVDVLGFLVLAALGITQLLPSDQLFSGFASDAVISLIAVMIVGSGLEKSGIVQGVARLILRVAKEHPLNIGTVLMITSGVLSSVMRSLGTVALLLPVVTRITNRTGIPKSQLLMPMAFCAILGGGLTMIGTSPLIILNSLLRNSDYYTQIKSSLAPFQIFTVFPVGLTLLLLGILYFLVLGRRLLPQEKQKKLSSGTTKAHFLKTYGKGTEIFELRLKKNSVFVKGVVKDLELKLDPSASVLGVTVGKEILFPPLRNTILEAGCSIALMGSKEIIEKFAKTYDLELYDKLDAFAEILHPVRSGFCEVVVPTTSKLIGEPLRELHMKRNYGLQILAVVRGQTISQGDELKDFTLRAGDMLGIYTRWDALADFAKNPDFAVLTTVYPKEVVRVDKMSYALFFFLLSLALILWCGFSVSIGLFLGAVGMIVTGVLTMDEAYEAVSWKTVFSIAGLIPLGLAIQSTHTAEWVVQHMPHISGGTSHLLLQTGLVIISTGVGLLISSVGATIVLVPIALDLAVKVGADPRMYALIVAIAASNSFIIPMQQVNALIMGPGNYRVKDFVKVGFIMTFLYWIGTLVAINLVF